MRFLNHTLPANVFDLGDFKAHRKVWLTYSAGLAAMANVAKIFLFQTTLLRLLTFYSDPWLWLYQSSSFGFIYFS